MDGCSVPYIFDTNCFIEGWHRTYTLKIMPDYWKLLAEDIVSGHIISPSQVKEEIYKKDDDLKTWMKKRQIVPKLLQEEKQQIENKCKKFKKPPENIKAFGILEADPYVIALAWLKNGTVVTAERDGKRSGDEHKIPLFAENLELIALTRRNI